MWALRLPGPHQWWNIRSGKTLSREGGRGPGGGVCCLSELLYWVSSCTLESVETFLWVSGSQFAGGFLDTGIGRINTSCIEGFQQFYEAVFLGCI